MVGVIGMATVAAHAQEQAAGSRSGFFWQPTLSVSETLTSNVGLDRGSNARADSITDINPGLRLSSRTGRIIGDVDYSLHGLVYARRSSFDEVQQALSAKGTAEAIDNWAYVDASASISQQSISALGTRSADRNLANGNRAEVSTYQLAPYVRGPLGSFANYVVRWEGTSSNSSGSSAKSTSNEASVVLSSGQALFSRLGWSLNASQQSSEFENQGTQEATRFNGRLTFAVTPEFQLSAGAGRERNDYQFAGQKSTTTWSAGFTWRPSERTRLEVSRDHRFFGNAYNIRFEHRTPRTVWTFVDGQDVNTTAGANGTGSLLSVFDLLYAQFASIAPDPAQRTALVNAFLQSSGLTGSTLVNGGFLTNAASIQRRQNLSLALIGVRTTLLMSTSRNDARAANETATNAGDLSNGRNLHSTGMGVNLSHRLTPLSALSADLSLSRNSSTIDNRTTRLRSLTTTYTTRLNPQVDLSISARRTLFHSDLDPYTESAVVANLKVQF
jgi:uncharacterized protein (PEP-CTERM system associated)